MAEIGSHVVSIAQGPSSTPFTESVFSPDNQYIAIPTGSSIQIRELPSNTRIDDFDNNSGSNISDTVTSLAFAKDSSRLAIGDASGNVTVVDIPDTSNTITYSSNNGAEILDLYFINGGKTLIYGDVEGFLIRWHLPTDDLAPYEGMNYDYGNIDAMAVAPNGKRALIYNEANMIYYLINLVDLSKESEHSFFSDDIASVKYMDFISNDRILIGYYDADQYYIAGINSIYSDETSYKAFLNANSGIYPEEVPTFGHDCYARYYYDNGAQISFKKLLHDGEDNEGNDYEGLGFVDASNEIQNSGDVVGVSPDGSYAYIYDEDGSVQNIHIYDTSEIKQPLKINFIDDNFKNLGSFDADDIIIGKSKIYETKIQNDSLGAVKNTKVIGLNEAEGVDILLGKNNGDDFEAKQQLEFTDKWFAGEAKTIYFQIDVSPDASAGPGTVQLGTAGIPTDDLEQENFETPAPPGGGGIM